MRVVVRVLTNEINHASPSDDPFLLEYIWSVHRRITVSNFGVDKPSFLFLQISSEIVDNISNEFEEQVSFFPFFCFFSMVKF